MRTCSICSHNQRKEIETLMVSGLPLRRIAPRFGTSEKTLRRHRQCIAEILKNTDVTKELGTVATVKEVLESLIEDMRFDITDLFDEKGQFNIEYIRKKGLGRRLKSVTFRRETNGAKVIDVVKVEAHNQLEAKKALLNAYTKLEITRQIVNAKNLTDKERIERFAVLLDRARSGRDGRD